MNNGGGRYSERERERVAERRLEKKIKKMNSNKRLTIGVGYSGRAALRRSIIMSRVCVATIIRRVLD
jgi:hypothetical protein